jgi:tRNA uridine 5-carboxymethylaminomethyl modification enzyme
VIFDRADGYLGVMVDDLITSGVSEPYRMFTSRAEYRLLLRADNADQRLTPIGISLGCVSDGRRKAFHEKMARLSRARNISSSLSLTPSEGAAHGLEISRDGARRSALDLLAYPGVSIGLLAGIWPSLSGLDAETAKQLENDARYAGYIRRQQTAAAAMRREDARTLPHDLGYLGLPGLSAELQQKLTAVQPETMGQAARIEGMTPAALALVLAAARRHPARPVA